MTAISTFRADKRLPGALAQTHRLLTKLQSAIDDVNVLVVGDSTGDDPGDWPDLFAEQLRALFPTHTMRFAYWSTSDYLAETVRQVGTGSTRLTTTLNTTIDNATTSVIVDNPNLLSFGGFPGAGVSPSPGSFYALIDSEAILVTVNPSGSTSTRTWTVTRAQLGTAAAAHTAGATIKYLPQIKFWNGGQAGTTAAYVYSKLVNLVRQTNADLVLLNYGHNEGTINDWLVARHNTYGKYMGVLAEIQSTLPFADIVIIAQNPQSANVYQGRRKAVLRDLAARTGHGFVDVHQAFLDYGATWAADLLLGDGVHPTAAGYQIWLNEIMRSFKALDSVDRAVLERMQLPDWLWRGGYAYLAESWAGYVSGTPTGWTAVTNSVYTKDTTAGNYDSVKAYALSIAGDTVNSVAPGLTYTFSAAQRAAMQGKAITVAARVKTPATWLNGSSSYGRITLTDNTMGFNSPALTEAKGLWTWLVMCRVLPTNLTSLSLKLNADTAANKDAQAWFDRVIVVPGLLMRDAAYS